MFCVCMFLRARAPRVRAVAPLTHPDTSLRPLAGALDCENIHDVEGDAISLLPDDGAELYLRERPSVECWSGAHRPLAVVAMTVLTLNITVSQMMGVYFGRIKMQGQEGLDIRYSQAYLHVTNAAKLMLVASAHALPAPLPFLICSVAIVLLSGTYTAFFSRLYSAPGAPAPTPPVSPPQQPPPPPRPAGTTPEGAGTAEEAGSACSIPWVLSLRVGVLYLGVAWAGSCSIAALLVLRGRESEGQGDARHEDSSPVETLGIVFLVGLAVLWLGAGAHAVLTQRRASLERRRGKAAGIAGVRTALTELVQVCLYVCICMYACMRACVYVCMHKYIDIYVCICLYT